MGKFEDQILASEGIPFNVAADFFIGIRQPQHDGTKTASMSEAPDETGELEGPFDVEKEQVAALLQDAITKMAALHSAAMVYEGSVRGPNKPCMWEWDYANGIKSLSKRASVLAGAVHLGEFEPPPATTDAKAAAKAMIRGEQELIQALNELKAVCGDNPLNHTACRMASEAQGRMDDYWRFLEPEAPELPARMAEPLGLEAPEADEAPEELETAEQHEGEGLEEEMPEEGPVKAAADWKKKLLGQEELMSDKPTPSAVIAEAMRKAQKVNPDASPVDIARKAQAEYESLEAGAPKEASAAGRARELVTGSKLKSMKAGARSVFNKNKSVIGKAREGKAIKDEARKVMTTRAGLAAAGAGAAGYAATKGDKKTKTAQEMVTLRKKDGSTTQVPRTALEAYAKKLKGRMDATERGVQSGLTQAKKNIVVDREQRGERYGKAIGSAGGALAGALAGKKLLGGTAGAALGAAGGYLSGGGLGKEVGRSQDIKRHMKKKANASDATALAGVLSSVPIGRRMAGNVAAGLAPEGRKARSEDIARDLAYIGAPAGSIGGLALAHKAGLLQRAAKSPYGAVLAPVAAMGAGGAAGGALSGLGVGAIQALRGSPKGYGKNTKAERVKSEKKEASAVFLEALQKIANPAMGMEQSAPMSSPTDTQQLEPTNYMQAELMGRQAQEQQESAFYKQQLQQASQAMQQMQQQMEMTGQQLQQVQQQAEMSGQQIQQSTQEALAAQDEALKQTQIAANMRMGMQKLRAQMLEVASQDPAEVAAQELQQQPQEAMPGEEGGPAGAMVNELAANDPGQAGEQAREAQRAEMNAQEQTAQAQATASNEATAAGQAGLKTASPALMAAGAVAGAGLGYMYHRHLADEADRMEENMRAAQKPTSFLGAMRQAAQKAQTNSAVQARDFPTSSALYHAGRGALAGATSGAAAGGELRDLMKG